MQLVENYDQVQANARRFSVVGDHQNTLAYSRFARFRHWYHFPDIGENVFAPSKFIGYRGTTIDGYSGLGNGGATERRLNRWFRKCERESRTFDILYERLRQFSKEIGQNLSQAVKGGDGGIHVINHMYPDEASVTNLSEGGKKQITVNAYERNIKARQQCLDEYGYQCRVCRMSFEDMYGDIGKEFIHVHHLVPVSKISRKYKIDPLQHLCPVCPNCHAMLHREEPPLTPEELANRMKKGRRF